MNNEILTSENIKQFETYFNNKIKLLYGFDNFTQVHNIELSKYYGKYVQEVYVISSYVDRDYEY
jgi:hypothetical protein